MLLNADGSATPNREASRCTLRWQNGSHLKGSTRPQRLRCSVREEAGPSSQHRCIWRGSRLMASGLELTNTTSDRSPAKLGADPRSKTPELKDRTGSSSRTFASSFVRLSWRGGGSNLPNLLIRRPVAYSRAGFFPARRFFGPAEGGFRTSGDQKRCNTLINKGFYDTQVLTSENAMNFFSSHSNGSRADTVVDCFRFWPAATGWPFRRTEPLRSVKANLPSCTPHSARTASRGTETSANDGGSR